MVSKNEIIMILSKLGMDSKYQAPYLYESEGRFGVVYSFTHKFYGILERVRFFIDQEDAYNFLYQYWWYRKYHDQFSVELLLDEYESLTPKVFFQMFDKDLTVSDMKSLLEDPEELPKEKKKQKLYQRYIRTSRILVKVIEEKIKVQNDTYRNVKELDLEFQKQENEFLQLYNRYQKTNLPLHDILDTPFEFVHMEEEIKNLNEQIDFLSKQINFDDITKFIDSLWETLLHMECEKGYLQNKYLLFKLPIDLEDVRKKISYMEYVFNKKKGLFSKKEHVLETLSKIDDESEGNKIIHMKDFIENEIKRLEEKYSIIEEMDYATLGDYINEFDNLGISLPFESQEKPKEKIFRREDILKIYRDTYESLSQDDQQSIIIYHSFLQPICDCILKGILNHEKQKDILNYVKRNYEIDITQGMSILEDPENVFLRMKKMKLLSVTNEEQFLESLYLVCENLLKIKTFKLKGISYVFGKSGKKDVLELYHASLKNIGSPVQVKGNYELYDILEITSGVSCLFLPKFYQVKDLYFHDNTIEEIPDREDVVLFLKNYQVNFENSDIIKVSRFSFKERMDESYKTFYDMKCVKVEQYRYLVITK